MEKDEFSLSEITPEINFWATFVFVVNWLYSVGVAINPLLYIGHVRQVSVNLEQFPPQPIQNDENERQGSSNSRQSETPV